MSIIEKAHCRFCQEDKNVSEFYICTNLRRKICKLCDNIRRSTYVNNKGYVKKITGFKKLDKKTQELIVADMPNLTLVQISKKYNILYGSLNYWNKKGYITVSC